MSPSSSRRPNPNKGGCLFQIALVLAVVVVLLVAGRACTAIGNSANSHETLRRGPALLAVLDSSGPVEPAEGSHYKGPYDELYAGDSNPGQKHTYFGSADYPAQGDADHKTAEDAYQAFQAHLVDEGWEKGSSEYLKDPEHHSYYSRGPWMIDVQFRPDQTATTGRVWFLLTSPPSGGFVIPGL